MDKVFMLGSDHDHGRYGVRGMYRSLEDAMVFGPIDIGYAPEQLVNGVWREPDGEERPYESSDSRIVARGTGVMYGWLILELPLQGR